VPAFSRSKPSFGTGIFFALLMFGAEARAAAPLPVNVPAGTGQQALSIAFAKGDVTVASCAAAPCSAGAVPLNVPPELRGKPARADVVSLGSGRRAAVIAITDGTSEYRAVVAAPLAAGAPKVLFSGLVGLLKGQPGSRSGPLVQVVDAGGGTRIVLVGEQNESVSLCGRATILAPRLLSAQDLELKGARVQRLSVAERNAARQVTATRVPDAQPSAVSSVLSALAASSAIGAPQALTDGDPETTWSEDVSGAGKGEFVVMRAPPELAISGLELTIRPKTRQVEGGAAPEQLFIAGPSQVVHVTLPQDAWQNPGARYHVPLDPPLQSSCLSLVLDTSFDQGASAKVSVAELSVVTEFSADALPALVAALAGGGQRAEAAKTLLMAGGAQAWTAVAQAFQGLDEGGRRVALEVMDRATCDISAPIYVSALTGKVEAQARHAESRLRRCGAVGGAALEAALVKSDKTDKRLLPLLITELTLVDPARAVKAFMPLMNEKTVLRRRLLRTALAHASRLSQAEPAIRAALGDPATPEVALIDLLRALGDSASRYQPEAGTALQRLQASAGAFRTRYLLLGPSAVLSRVDPAAEGAFRRSLSSDPDPHVRAAALALVKQPQRFRAELLKALDDQEVRVREASVHALGSADGAFASQALSKSLAEDRWPLVRAAAADALAKHPASPKLDEPLTDALSDESALVRARTIRALGERNVRRAVSRIRDRLIDDQEWPEVRAEAARSLGTLCDAESIDILAAFAKKLTDPMASPDAQLIATGAVLSLGRLAPPNLKETLAPLSAKKAPPQARRAAASALSARQTCRTPAPKH
jgi:HEAT repeat protein